MVKKRGLGKTLDALLAYTGSHENAETDPRHETLTQVSVSDIERGKYQPRREMDPRALEDLANSIRTQGIIQPLIVRPVGNRYEIIAGERRWQAAKLAGLSEVPAIIRVIPDEAAVAIALIENIQRENLNPIDEALALQRLIQEFAMTHEQIAEAIGKSRASISNLLRLLNLENDVKTMLEQGLLEMGHARTLITLPAALQLKIAKIIVTRELSVRETENFVRKIQQTDAGTSKRRSLDPHLVNLQDNLSKQFNLPVNIQCNKKGKGKLVIHYRNLRELDHLLAQFVNA